MCLKETCYLLVKGENTEVSAFSFLYYPIHLWLLFNSVRGQKTPDKISHFGLSISGGNESNFIDVRGAPEQREFEKIGQVLKTNISSKN